MNSIKLWHVMLGPRLSNHAVGGNRKLNQRRSIRKYQWFKFSDGEYHEIDQNDVLNNYFSLLVFYRQIN